MIAKPWFKKFGNEDFNVSMGCFDEAEVCELVCSFQQSFAMFYREKMWDYITMID